MGLGRCGEGVGLGLRIRIGVIVAEGRAGGKEPVHGPLFRSPEASAPRRPAFSDVDHACLFLFFSENGQIIAIIIPGTKRHLAKDFL